MGSLMSCKALSECFVGVFIRPLFFCSVWPIIFMKLIERVIETNRN